MDAKTIVTRALFLVSLAAGWGCGGPGLQVQQAQVLMQAEGPKQTSQAQLQLQLYAGRAGLAAYRDYQVGPEDLLEVQVYGQDKLSRQVRVNGLGEISLPLVGDVQVAGLSPQEIEKRLTKAYGANFLRNPQVSVAVKEYRHQRVSVTGAVDKPGSGVKFPMFAKSRVAASAGASANPLFADLAQRTGQWPRWNFHKYLVARDGTTATSFASEVDPLDKAFQPGRDPAGGKIVTVELYFIPLSSQHTMTQARQLRPATHRDMSGRDSMELGRAELSDGERRSRAFMWFVLRSLPAWLDEISGRFSSSRPPPSFARGRFATILFPVGA